MQLRDNHPLHVCAGGAFLTSMTPVILTFSLGGSFDVLTHDDDDASVAAPRSLSNSERQECIQMEEDTIRKYIFKGHKGSVLCLAHASVSSLLLSGSEDETARLWDLRTSKTALCLLAGGEVTSVAFVPSATLQPLDGPFARNNHV